MVKYSVIISPRAKLSIQSIYQYYQKYISSQMANNIRNGIKSDIRLLASQPSMGRHLHFENKKAMYFVSINDKIIYGINEEFKIVNIFDVFDSRQNPSKLNP